MVFLIELVNLLCVLFFQVDWLLCLEMLLGLNVLLLEQLEVVEYIDVGGFWLELMVLFDNVDIDLVKLFGQFVWLDLLMQQS